MAGRLFSGPPTWVLRDPATLVPAIIDLDFANTRYWQAAPVIGRTVGNLLTVPRASVGYNRMDNVAGLWAPIPANVARVSAGVGLMSEEQRTNVVLWSRDATNAVWVKTNVTAALDQVGIDGVAGSASSLTATAANGTCLQVTSAGSAVRYLTCVIKRLVGIGPIEMTMDNGSTWTAVAVSASWAGVNIPPQTLASPTVGFRIVTSGDSIAVDFVQNEAGAFSTSPILATSSAATRASDTPLLKTLPTLIGSVYVDMTPSSALSVGSAWQLLSAADITDWTGIHYTAVLVVARVFENNAAVAVADTAYVAPARFKSAMAFATNDFAHSLNGAAVVTDSSLNVPAPPYILKIGDGRNGSANGYIRRFAAFATRIPNASLIALTT